MSENETYIERCSHECHDLVEHSLIVTSWSISDKKRIAAEFLCKCCWQFFTREQVEGFNTFKIPLNTSLADSGEAS